MQTLNLLDYLTTWPVNEGGFESHELLRSPHLEQDSISTLDLDRPGLTWTCVHRVEYRAILYGYQAHFTSHPIYRVDVHNF